jgi:hypothetical protein
LIRTDSYIIAWIIFYVIDGTVILKYSSKSYFFDSLPKVGLQLIKIFYSDNTTRTVSGYDFYFFQEIDNLLIIGGTNDLHDTLNYNNPIIKQGIHAPDMIFKTINDIANDITIDDLE